jgi:hypothetical protein
VDENEEVFEGAFRRIVRAAPQRKLDGNADTAKQLLKPSSDESD